MSASPRQATLATTNAATSSPGPSNGTSQRHHLDPHEQQARALEKLLRNPDKPVHIPAPPREKTLRPPREMQRNVAGSSAGAGSGEFHIYKQARRREYERIRLMEEGAQKIMDADDFERRRALQAQQDQAKTDKNRSRRDKKKLAALKAKAAARGQDPKRVTLQGREGDGQRNDEADGDDANKRRRIHNEQAGSILFRRRDEDGEEDGDEEEEDEDDEAGQ